MKEQYPMVTVEFKHLNPFRCLLSEWKEMGGYKGFLKRMAIPINAVKSVKYQVLDADKYPTKSWEG